MSQHQFHIPVMGIGFTIDTPLRISPLGISSVISMVDDELMEKLRAFYCNKHALPYQAITPRDKDFRAGRVTSWLNLVKDLADQRFKKVRSSQFKPGSDIARYFEMLPDNNPLLIKYQRLKTTVDQSEKKALEQELRDNMVPGVIDVNIMTKIDKTNYRKGKKLPSEHNDAHAALRGFAKSRLNSSLVLSAGINRSLYSYIPEFEDFFPDHTGRLKKRIVLKVSDYKSAFIQGKFLAKKGIWISEYRVESGLNCGGHAFASDGFLLGPILEAFKNSRAELHSATHTILIRALKAMGKPVPKDRLPIKITVQGGIGTHQEHNMLMKHYEVDRTGWGTPFLLVPEVTNVDDTTLDLLLKAKENDLYLSNISPIGVLFNSLVGNTKDIEKQKWIEAGTPGSPCPKNFLVSNTDFTDRPICTASRQYQTKMLEQLETKDLTEDARQKETEKIHEKACICVGLGTAALLVNKIDTSKEGNGVIICPGPNLAYFSKILSLEDMVDHIYGRKQVIDNPDIRPHMFIKELEMYVGYLKERVQDSIQPLVDKQKKYFYAFQENLREGIAYYKKAVDWLVDDTQFARTRFLQDLSELEIRLSAVISRDCHSV